MERLLSKTVFMLYLVAISLCLSSSTALAQYIVINAPDDSSWIDLSYVPNPGPDTTGSPNASPGKKTILTPSSALFSPLSTPVNSVQISQIDCSRFPLMCMYVDVLDASGNPIGGMTADSFCVKEDSLSISSFTVQQVSLDSCRTSVCLVVDVSSSMSQNHKLDSAKAAMNRFVNNMDAYDRIAIVPYSDCIGTVTNFTSNKTTLHNAINALHASGFTACYDGIYKGVDLTRFELGSKAVIAFTDGLENRSQYCSQPPDGVNDGMYSDDSTLICNLANGAGLPIYTFNLGPIDYQFYNPNALQAFSNATGGSWGHAPTGSGIDSLYTRIKVRLCSRYYICYNSVDTVQNGDTHMSIVCHKSGATCSPCDTAFCQESAPPQPHRNSATVHLSDTCQAPTANINICAWTYDKDTPVDSLVVTLFYKFNGDPSYTSVAMTHSPGDSLFCSTILASQLSCKSQLDYYITASDGQHNVSDPASNPQTSPYVIQICPNRPPVANAGRDTTLAQCTTAQVCIAANCSDPDGNLSTCELISSPGTLSGGNICFTPTGTGTYTFILKATDACGLTDYDTSIATVTINQATSCQCRAETQRYSSALRPRSALRPVALIRMAICRPAS